MQSEGFFSHLSILPIDMIDASRFTRPCARTGSCRRVKKRRSRNPQHFKARVKRRGLGEDVEKTQRNERNRIKKKY